MPDRDAHATELSRALLAARVGAGVRQVDVAGLLSGDPPKPLTQARLSRIENGKALPTDDEVRKLGHAYRLDDQRTAELLQMASEQRGGIEDRRLIVQRGQTLALQQQWKRIEGDAAVIRAYHPVVVLGPMQTRAYASVVMQQAPDSEAVQSRLDRGTRMFAEHHRRHLLIQTEGALRQTVGDAETMAEQLDAIRNASEAPNVEIGVIPAARALPFVAGTGFDLYDDIGVIVGIEIAAARLTEPDDIERFRAVWDRLRELVVTGDEMRELLGEIRQGHRLR